MLPPLPDRLLMAALTVFPHRHLSLPALGTGSACPGLNLGRRRFPSSLGAVCISRCLGGGGLSFSLFSDVVLVHGLQCGGWRQRLQSSGEGAVLQRGVM